MEVAQETLTAPAAKEAVELSGSQALLDALIIEGVDTIFGYPGGVLLPLYHVFSEYP